MSESMNPTRLFALVEDMRNQSAEASWFEFKGNNSDPKKIAKTISAIANAARLVDREMGFIIWGISDETHGIVGTKFDPATQKISNQSFHMWLSQHLKPYPNLQFHTFEHPDGRLVLGEIPAATSVPVAFEGVPYIRLGSATPPLNNQVEI